MKKFFERINAWYVEYKRKKMQRFVSNLYQLEERDGVIWITYGGACVAPANMFKEDDPVLVISLLMHLYSERHRNDVGTNCKE